MPVAAVVLPAPRPAVIAPAPDVAAVDDDQAQHLSGLGHLDLGYSTWGQA